MDQGIDAPCKPVPARSDCMQLFPVQSVTRVYNPHVSHETNLQRSGNPILRDAFELSDQPMPLLVEG